MAQTGYLLIPGRYILSSGYFNTTYPLAHRLWHLVSNPSGIVIHRLVSPLLIVLVLEIYLRGSVRDWFSAGGYGSRRFSSDLVIFIVGYAGLFVLYCPKCQHNPIC